MTSRPDGVRMTIAFNEAHRQREMPYFGQEIFLQAQEKGPLTTPEYLEALETCRRLSRAEGLDASSINGDAYSEELKSQTADLIAGGIGGVDLVVYSLAAPVRRHPKSGDTHRSVLKPLGNVYEGKTLDTDRDEVKEVRIEPASEREVEETVSVMGGEDWEWWIDTLDGAGLLADGCRSIAYTYIGPELTWPVYWEGTIGRAKEDLDRAAASINDRLDPRDGWAGVAVMKALVTQASSAIPVVPLYISLLYKIMKEKGVHEGCIEQIQRLFARRLYAGAEPALDPDGRVRMDDWEMSDDVQSAVNETWSRITTDNLNDLTDYAGYKAEFLKLFGFGLAGVDYDADVDPIVAFEK